MITAALVLGIAISAATAQDKQSDNAKHIAERGKLDIALIRPQLSLGGDDDKIVSLKFATETWKPNDEAEDPIEATWCIPNGYDKTKKYPLLLTFHGDGGTGPNMAKAVSKSSAKEVPLIVAGVSWQNGKRSLRGGGIEGFVGQINDMLAALKVKYPFDESRMFVSGFSAGVTVAEWLVTHQWENSPDEFQWRAVFFHSKGFDSRKTYPPIPYIVTVGENEESFHRQLTFVRTVCNRGRQKGMDLSYHEIPCAGHELPVLVHKIVRDHIAAFVGKGCDLYRRARGDQEPPDALPFESEDTYVKELIALCNANDWAGALARAEEIKNDKAIKTKFKKDAKKFPKVMEKAAKKILPDLGERLEKAIEDEVFPQGWVVARLKGMTAAWPNETWVKNRNYGELLSKLETDFEPAKRERQREALFLEARELEESDFAAAKAKYEELAARKDEDNGKSLWPGAAAYRLKWWIG
jgi:predicted esterase